MNDKPISIILDDLKTNIANTINEAELPPCLVEPIIKDIYLEVIEASKRQLVADREEYEKKQAVVEE